MQYVKALALLLLIVGGINWLLVGVMEFDLVASLTGSTFGETNPISTSFTPSSACPRWC